MRAGVAGLALILSAAGPAFAQDEASGPFRAAPCTEVIGYSHAHTRCGWLDVAESPRGRALSLAVSIVGPTGPDRADGDETPLVFLHGGPGGAIADAARRFATHPMAATRQVILFDQRASGLSMPRDCPAAPQAFLDVLAADLAPAASVEAQAEIERGCRAAMLAAGADLDGYGTRETVADMETLRDALGIAEWNVMGVSYGTTVALDYVRLHPERIRAVVLDSVYPPSLASSGDLNTRNFARALEALYDACRADAACRTAYPGLETSFLATLIALERTPLVVPVADTDLAPTGEFHLNSQDFALIVHQLMYQDATIAAVPKLVSLVAERNANGVAGLIAMLGPLATRLDLTARLAVECRDRWGREGREIAGLDRLERFLRHHLRFFDTEDVLCAEWARTPTAPGFAEPVASPLPALFYAGRLDPITPPASTVDVFRRFPAGQLVIAPHTGHGVDRSHACARSITAAFLDAPRVPVADACIAAVPPVAFVTDAALSRGVLPFASDVLQGPEPVPAGILAIGALAALGGVGWGALTLLRARPGRARRPGTLALAAAFLISLACLAALAFLASLTVAVAGAAAGQSPAILAFGLPPEDGWLLMLPWAVFAAWAAGALALAGAMARGGAATASHRPFLVAAAGVALLLVQLWAFGFFAPAG